MPQIRTRAARMDLNDHIRGPPKLMVLANPGYYSRGPLKLEVRPYAARLSLSFIVFYLFYMLYCILGSVFTYGV
ncbi:hypothetical protein Hanom_Chr16g01445241 [Helianthus anomalus]